MAILNVKVFTVNDEGFEAEIYMKAARYVHWPISREIMRGEHTWTYTHVRYSFHTVES